MIVEIKDYNEELKEVVLYDLNEKPKEDELFNIISEFNNLIKQDDKLFVKNENLKMFESMIGDLKEYTNDRSKVDILPHIKVIFENNFNTTYEVLQKLEKINKFCVDLKVEWSIMLEGHSYVWACYLISSLARQFNLLSWRDGEGNAYKSLKNVFTIVKNKKVDNLKDTYKQINKFHHTVKFSYSNSVKMWKNLAELINKRAGLNIIKVVEIDR